MTTAAPSTALATIQPAFTDAERLVGSSDVGMSPLLRPELIILFSSGCR